MVKPQIVWGTLSFREEGRPDQKKKKKKHYGFVMYGPSIKLICSFAEASVIVQISLFVLGRRH